MIINTEVKLLSQTEALESLLSRISSEHSHRKFLELELHQRSAGIRGESRMQSRFKEFHLDEEFHILWDVHLQIDSWKVQMDGLLLTERCAIIIDSKNISGRIHFDEQTGEFYRFDNEDRKAVMEDPRIQLNKHKRFLARWFKLKKIELPIEGLIVFTAKKCEFMSKPFDTHICKTYQMPEHLLKAYSASPLEAPAVKLSHIKKVLQKNLTPYRRIPLCQQYHIPIEDLKTGVYCRGCTLLTMQRNKRNWQCTKCGVRDPFAHEFALQEYFSLVDKNITNQQFRNFCGFESRHVATRILDQYNFQASGHQKSRTYHL